MGVAGSPLQDKYELTVHEPINEICSQLLVIMYGMRLTLYTHIYIGGTHIIHTYTHAHTHGETKGDGEIQGGNEVRNYICTTMYLPSGSLISSGSAAEG